MRRGRNSFCNSILQCLYYSVPFREAVINYPRRAPQESLDASLAKNLRYPDLDVPVEEPKPKPPPVSSAARTAGIPVTQPQKPEDNKDSQEYKKKVAMHRLPLLDTSDNAAGYGMNESLFTSLKDIFESVIASPERTGIIRPNHFLDVLRREYEPFRPRVHQDAHEFLNLLLNVVVANVEAEARRTSPEADQQSDSQGTDTTDSVSPGATVVNGTKSPTNTRWVHELFEGTLTSETQCLTCEQVSQRDEVFLDLSVDLEQHGSVTSCLRKFSEEEMLCERNKFHCDNCGGLQEAEKRMKVKRLPRVLALHLKRFEYTDDFQRMYKLFHRVPYPDHLRLFNTTDDVEDPDRLYELYAVVVHIGGGPHHGHYVAIIKTENKGWLLFDDELVEPVSRTYVRNFFGDRSSQACAYVLFYQETTVEAVQKELEKEETQPQWNAADLKETMPQPKMNGTAAAPNNLRRANSTQAENATWKQTMHFSSSHPETSVPVPPTPPTPKSPFGALTSRKSDIHLKKVRTKEEKVAEKEKEKTDKQNRKDQEAKAKDEVKRREAEHKEEHRRGESSKSEKEDGSIGGTFAHGLSRLKRRKSTSQGKMHKTHQDNAADAPDVPPVPHISTPHADNADHTRLERSTELPNDHGSENSGQDQQGSSRSAAEQTDDESRDTLGDKPTKRPSHRHRRFSFKNKSFSVF